MKFQIDNGVIASYKRLSYEPWYAFAEFVDNSTQAYFNNRLDLDRLFELTGKKLTIKIVYDRDNDYIFIKDNSIGMNKAELENALTLGLPPENPSGRSRYGLGMKTASCWFGNTWTIKTKKLGEQIAHRVSIDVDKISKNDNDLKYEAIEDTELSHYTEITITKLNRQFKGRTLGKIRDFLGSMYRFDFKRYGLELYWNNEQVVWEGFEDRLHITTDGVRYKKEFEFEVNGKTVKGWVGVLGKGHGSRRHAGFSIVQNWRVIQGWPNGYKPISIFGDQEDGSNDLVNQRVIGEISLEGFSVSHTKDRIVWEGDDEDILDEKLGHYCSDARELAISLRFTKDSEINDLAKYKFEALTYFEKEINSNEVSNYIRTTQVYPEKIIKSSYSKSATNVIEDNEPALEVNIGDDDDRIHVLIYFNEKSEFEPYVLIEITIEENKVIVIINALHPHFQEMENSSSILNFIRHCVYDGVAEWKSLKIRGELSPYTIKFLKDGLLRIPFEIKTKKGI